MGVFWNEGDIAARKWDILSFPSWTNFVNKNFWKPEILFGQKLPIVKWGIHPKFHENRLENKKVYLGETVFEFQNFQWKNGKSPYNSVLRPRIKNFYSSDPP